MQTILLDISGCDTREELFSALLAALGAPDWHGTNLDAVWDSITSDEINQIKAPYRLEVHGQAQSKSVADMLVALQRLFAEARAEGVQVDLVLKSPASGWLNKARQN